ncbi:hypothetical protein HDU76_007756 [Blyttiomyces sp. JEL0837]|nr:hypothetical protein HDU76_007756 [Blyttiomyces sp. JEL0837]
MEDLEGELDGSVEEVFKEYCEDREWSDLDVEMENGKADGKDGGKDCDSGRCEMEVDKELEKGSGESEEDKEKDRQEITREELMGYEFQFGDDWGYSHFNRDVDRSDADNITRVRFWPDGTRGNVKGKNFRPRPQSWAIIHTGAIQVGQFPRHSVPRRTEDWGWKFSNGYVTYTSL